MMNEMGEFLPPEDESEQKRREAYKRLRGEKSPKPRPKKEPRVYGKVGDLFECPACGKTVRRKRRDQRCCSKKCSDVMYYKENSRGRSGR